MTEEQDSLKARLRKAEKVLLTLRRYWAELAEE
jgi:hypothetical protein